MPAQTAHEIHPERVRAAVFDWGGVLFEGGPREVVAFGTRVGVPAEEWASLRRTVFGNEGTWARLERGECTFAEFIEDLRSHVHSAGGRATVEVAAAFMGASDPRSRRSVVRERMIEAVRSLRRLMSTALLTNNVRECTWDCLTNWLSSSPRTKPSRKPSSSSGRYSRRPPSTPTCPAPPPCHTF